MSDSLRPHGLYSPWNSPGQNTGVGRLSLLQGIFPTQELNQGLLHCRRIIYQLNYEGNPSSTPGLGRPPRKGKAYPLQYSGLKNSTDRGAWWATVCGVTKSQKRLSAPRHPQHEFSSPPFFFFCLFSFDNFSVCFFKNIGYIPCVVQ